MRQGTHDIDIYWGRIMRRGNLRIRGDRRACIRAKCCGVIRCSVLLLWCDVMWGWVAHCEYLRCEVRRSSSIWYEQKHKKAFSFSFFFFFTVNLYKETQWKLKIRGCKLQRFDGSHEINLEEKKLFSFFFTYQLYGSIISAKGLKP